MTASRSDRIRRFCTGDPSSSWWSAVNEVLGLVVVLAVVAMIAYAVYASQDERANRASWCASHNWPEECQ